MPLRQRKPVIPRAEVIIDRVRDHRTQTRSMGAVRGLMIHRCGIDLKSGVVIGYDAVEICDAFTGRDERWPTVAKATNGQNPYTFYVGGDRGHADLHGQVWQALDLNEIGHHGRGCSSTHIGIGLIGDFRVDMPGAKQWGAAVSLCADLCLMLGLAPSRVVGHGEVDEAHGGSKAPGQPAACPGDRLVMGVFRESLSGVMKTRVNRDAAWRLEDSGYRLP